MECWNVTVDVKFGDSGQKDSRFDHQWLPFIRLL